MTDQVAETRSTGAGSDLELDDITVGNPAPQVDTPPSNEEPGQPANTDTEEPATPSTPEPSAGEGDDSDPAQAAEPAATGAEPSPEPTEETDDYTNEEVNDFVYQITGHNTPEELQAELTELRSQAENPQGAFDNLSPFTRDLIDFESKGGDPVLFAYAQGLDVEGMSAKDVLKEQFLLDHPGVDQKKAERAFEVDFKSKYAVTDEHDEDEKEAREALLDLEAHKGRQSLKEAQKNATQVPERQEAQQEQEIEVSPEQEQAYNEHMDTVQDMMDRSKSFSIPMDDNEQNDFIFKPTPEIKEQVGEWFKIPSAPTDNPMFQQTVTSAIFADDDNPDEIDYEKANLIMSFIADPEEYNKQLLAHGHAKGHQASVTRKTNSNAESPHTTYDTDTDMSLADAMDKSLQQRG